MWICDDRKYRSTVAPGSVQKFRRFGRGIFHKSVDNDTVSSIYPVIARSIGTKYKSNWHSNDLVMINYYIRHYVFAWVSIPQNPVYTVYTVYCIYRIQLLRTYGGFWANVMEIRNSYLNRLPTIVLIRKTAALHHLYMFLCFGFFPKIALGDGAKNGIYFCSARHIFIFIGICHLKLVP